MTDAVLHIARVVVETATPLSISTGNPDGNFDTRLVTDANDLPAIPGSSLAGVMRHLYAGLDAVDEQRLNDVFGFQDRNLGQASSLAVSWGVMLDSQGRAVEGLLSPDSERLSDPLIAEARRLTREAPAFRHRVAINDKGAAADTGKFDRAVLPTGYRFALELRFREDKDSGIWQDLLGLLHHPGFRLGGGTRAGLGKLRVCSVHARSFTLRESARALQQLPAGLHETDGLEDITGACQGYRPNDQGWQDGRLILKPRGAWRIGAGHHSVAELLGQDGPEAANTMLPVTEGWVRWEKGKAQIVRHKGKRLLVPGSSLKGALRHRFVYYSNCLAGRWAEDGQGKDTPEEVKPLFGELKGDGSGQAGRLYLDDSYLSLDKVKSRILPHNSIDRFTGGVRDRVLFAEEVISGATLDIPIRLNVRPIEDLADTALKQRIIQALKLTLDDLCQGRLAFGARTTSGNGFFEGELTGSLRDWLDRQSGPEADSEKAEAESMEESA
ncbi:RAMP superfamily CRISPR-associated protein [Gammaproteobacteria bacterium AB-CW1]|uniref:RAMP superfamily CRISPR-associated protein n=1 Tax=Natronospira elongata TaxID=3110268 RepID=A0AAP6JHH6_9GAMM|nr:RAMP superfamily CRISPR-associated protein [Gammaproteobacteria bacterium AB-CW1]